jgi:hypothetical protein
VFKLLSRIGDIRQFVCIDILTQYTIIYKIVVLLASSWQSMSERVTVQTLYLNEHCCKQLPWHTLLCRYLVCNLRTQIDYSPSARSPSRANYIIANGVYVGGTLIIKVSNLWTDPIHYDNACCSILTYSCGCVRVRASVCLIVTINDSTPGRLKGVVT